VLSDYGQMRIACDRLRLQLVGEPVEQEKMHDECVTRDFTFAPVLSEPHPEEEACSRTHSMSRRRSGRREPLMEDVC
jgi:hypothetical protein